MAIENLQSSKTPEKEHRFIPAAFGLLSGAIASVIAGRKIVNAKLHQWVLERIHYGDDPAVKTAVAEIEAEIASVKKDPKNALKIMDEVKHRHMSEMSAKLDKLEKKSKEKQGQKLKIAEDNARSDVEKTIKYELKEHFERNPTLTEKEIEAAEKVFSHDKEARVSVVLADLRPKIKSNYSYFFNRAKAKQIINPEVIDRMGLHLRMAEGRKLAFVGGGVVLGVIGYAGYKIADIVLNGKGGKHSKALINRRIDAENHGATTTSVI